MMMMTHSDEKEAGKHVPAEIPSNIYKLKTPLQTKILKSVRLTDKDSPNEVRHIEIDLEGSELWYLDGQSIGILPPGEDPESGRPHKLRLYSIASPSVGDDGAGKTVSLCVKRLVFSDEAGEEYRGICSNYLCDLAEGAPVQVTGPVGKSFLLPPYENANMVMVATGTGIAPFRAFLKTRYSKRADESGQTHLFFGAQYRSDFLYQDELEHILGTQETFKLHTAFSREEKNAEGGRCYVQHRLYEQRETILNLLQQEKTYFYICGLKGMEAGIIEMLEKAATEAGIDWAELYTRLKNEHRWHIEVY